MKISELRLMPAYMNLTHLERSAVDARLQDWPDNLHALASVAGDAGVLEAEDLRWWLQTTTRRPWTPPRLSLGPRAEGLWRALMALAPAGDAQLARALARAADVCEQDRAELGFVRDEQVAALQLRVDGLGGSEPEWTEGAVFAAMSQAGLAELVQALQAHARADRGVRGLLSRLVDGVRTELFDLGQLGVFLGTGATSHEGRYDGEVWRNWTRSYQSRPAAYRLPRSEAEICAAVANAEQLRVVGAGHTFNDSPLTRDTMLSLDAYDAVLNVDAQALTARVQAGVRLRDLNRVLWGAGLGLPVLGSTDAQSIGGLVATDLHGTGRDQGFLSEQVRSLRVVDAMGQARTVRPGDDLFHAALGGLGVCGVVVEVELQLVPAFNLVKQTTMVDRAETEADIDALVADNDHLSFYYIGGERCESVRMHRWNRSVEPVTDDWQMKKTRAELSDHAISAFLPTVAEGIAALDEDNPVSNLLAPDHRLVVPGSHGFGRALFYRHDEIEYGLPFDRWRACAAQVIDLLERRSFFSVLEVRFTPDCSQALLGPGVGRRTAFVELATPLSLHNAEVYAEAEQLLQAHGGRPHLGKKTSVTADDMLAMFGERYARFQAVRRRQDPQGKFLNPFARRVFGGA